MKSLFTFCIVYLLFPLEFLFASNDPGKEAFVAGAEGIIVGIMAAIIAGIYFLIKFIYKKVFKGKTNE